MPNLAGLEPATCGLQDDGESVSDGSSGVGIGDTAAIRELDALNKEIEDLRKEKDVLNSDVQGKEHVIKTTTTVVQVCPHRLSAYRQMFR